MLKDADVTCMLSIDWTNDQFLKDHLCNVSVTQTLLCKTLYSIVWGLMKWLEAKRHLFLTWIAEVCHYRPTVQFPNPTLLSSTTYCTLSVSLLLFSPQRHREDRGASLMPILDHHSALTTLQPLIFHLVTTSCLFYFSLPYYHCSLALLTTVYYLYKPSDTDFWHNCNYMKQ